MMRTGLSERCLCSFQLLFGLGRGDRSASQRFGGGTCLFPKRSDSAVEVVTFGARIGMQGYRLDAGDYRSNVGLQLGLILHDLLATVRGPGECGLRGSER